MNYCLVLTMETDNNGDLDSDQDMSVFYLTFTIFDI